ncbi:sigma-70 family RNA polymerase sigma factor [Streptomyces sp. NBC_00006]|uniref:RNA polymerase sigma factor n=1 Tax=Streptomyces sp. NBC_00006 TaxID=2975619 RepID=UPI00225A0388|nr:sigma-70 family RNA polymerase sigma factor [Streptomyces sp. NBC_00006]MCX5535035.1 sigma-70 family RNA polymerase sigma factor [Streptomyces sp. NBC_00006]
MPMDMPDTPNAAAAAGRGTHSERWLRVWSHREELLRVARRGSVTPEDAEDAVHEAMLRAAERPGLDDDRLGGWLTTVTMRLCVDRHRQVTREAEVHRSPTLTVPGPVPVEEAVCDRDEARWLAARSARLPERQAEALRLKSEGLDVGEVAVRMRLGYRTVESLLARARRTLRSTLAGTLGLALFLWGRGRLVASGPAQAVVVSSTTAGLVVAGFVVPDAVKHGAAEPRVTESRVAGANTGDVRPVGDAGSGSAIPRVREERDAQHRGAASPVRTEPGPERSGSTEEGPTRWLPTVALPSVSVLRVTVSLPALGSNPPQSPAPARTKSAPAATDRPPLPRGPVEALRPRPRTDRLHQPVDRRPERTDRRFRRRVPQDDVDPQHADLVDLNRVRMTMSRASDGWKVSGADAL